MRFVVTMDNYQEVIDAINKHLALAPVKRLWKTSAGKCSEMPFYGKAKEHWLAKDEWRQDRKERVLIALADMYNNCGESISEGNIVILNQFGIFIVKNVFTSIKFRFSYK